ncbi:MAG: SpoIIE family protein phosphatase [Phycisphaerales bacterium]|nr:SpoIIE family protein phosphatase [Phycisphaerales bacterium]
MHGSLSIARTQGPNDPIVQEEYTIDRDTRIGRAVESDICLPDPSVSRRHATILIRQGLWYLVDQGSTTGTLLNRQRLEQDEPAEIRKGDTIEIGPWSFRVKDDETITQTIDFSRHESGVVHAEELSSRRLDALGGYLAAIGNADSKEEIACCTIEAALAGTGFKRGAVLLAPTNATEPPSFLVGLRRTPSGITDRLPSAELHASSKLVSRALDGLTARYSAPDTNATIDHSRSLMEHSIMAALCVPILRDGVVESLLYLDSPGANAGVEDAVGYCEDIASLCAYALTHRAHAELAHRQQAMRIEFEHAKELRAMLTAPSSSPSPEFRSAYRSVAGMFVSADFFDTVPHQDGSLHVLFGDATGHGLGASILSTLVHAHLVALLRSGADTAESVTATNRFIAEKATAGRFVSLVVAHLNPNGVMTIVDAGHGHWIHRSGSDLYSPKQASDVPIGIGPAATFTAQSRTLSRGDRLILYTDGITEQHDEDGNEFGAEKLRSIISRSDDSGSDVDHVFKALLAHAGKRAIEDDATVSSIELVRRS